MLEANGTLLTATLKGELKTGDNSFKLAAPTVYDGLAAAYGRIYAALENGSVVCLQ